MKIYIVPDTGVPVVDKITKYYQMDYNTFIDLLFFKLKDSITITTSIINADIQLCGIQTTSQHCLNNKLPTILMCVENTSIGRKHYKHYNEYLHFNDNRIDIYIYNDLSKIILTNKYIAIPFIYLYIDQFNRLSKEIVINEIPFDNRRFCLFASQNLLNNNKKTILEQLHKIGPIYSITQHPLLIDKSCYHSPELIKVFSFYKFIICFENSKSNGYITEKLFNVFLAGSIPIYDGAFDLDKFININSILLYDDPLLINKIIKMNSNYNEYKSIIQLNKISENYNNEDWQNTMFNFIQKIIN